MLLSSKKLFSALHALNIYIVVICVNFPKKGEQNLKGH
ncbi:TPT domain-containing protein [Psidium guajava]|nr:TPT domain-containing protein [Psidium guajava]